jgi:hypothetical protein
MRRTGYELTIGFPSRYGGENIETLGTLAPQHAVQVGDRMWIKGPPRPERTRPFPAGIKRVRVVYVGGPLNDTTEDIPVDDFGCSARIRRLESPDIVHEYLPHGCMEQIKGALWAGYWVLASTTDFRNPGDAVTTQYKLPPMPNLPPLSPKGAGSTA